MQRASNAFSVSSCLAFSFRVLTFIDVSIGRGSDGYASHESTKLAGELCHEILSVHTSKKMLFVSPMWLMFAGIYHAMTWPQISFVAEDHKGRIVGYVLAKMYGPSLVLHSIFCFCFFDDRLFADLAYSAKKSRRKTTRKTSFTDMSILYLYSVRTDVWALPRN